MAAELFRSMKSRPEKSGSQLERVTGIEPATFSLGIKLKVQPSLSFTHDVQS